MRRNKNRHAVSLRDRKTVKRFTVPGDVLVDVLYVVNRSGIRYQITEVNRDQSNVTLRLSCDGSGKFEEQAIENIDCMISDYMNFLTGGPDESFYDEL